MNNAPTIVRLIRFPASLRLTRKGKQFIGPQRRSGPVILSERHDPIDCTFRVTAPGVTFTTGATTITHTEAFAEGEQRDLLLPWGLIVDADARVPQLILEIDVSYSGTTDLHTATVPLKLTYGMSSGRAAAAAGAAIAAVAIGAAVASRRKKKTAPAKKASIAKKKSPAKKSAAKKPAGGTRRGSGASKPAPRKGAPGSSSARKSASRRTTRKSR